MFAYVERPFVVCVSFFECVFTNSFVTFGLVILYVTLYWHYVEDIFQEAVSVVGASIFVDIITFSGVLVYCFI